MVSYVSNTGPDITYKIRTRKGEYEITYDKQRKKWLGVWFFNKRYIELNIKECFRVLDQAGIRGQHFYLGEHVDFCVLKPIDIRVKD